MEVGGLPRGSSSDIIAADPCPDKSDVVAVPAARLDHLQEPFDELLEVDRLVGLVEVVEVACADAVATFEQKASELQAQADAHRELSSSLAHDDA